jgi:hypothetical protein
MTFVAFMDPPTFKFVAEKFVVVTFVNTPFVTKRSPPVAYEKFKVVTVDDPAENSFVITRVVPEAFVKVVFARVVVPVMFKVTPPRLVA